MHTNAVSITYRVPYADTDMMGVVYYGNYLAYFERCRNELMRATGVTYRQIEDEGAMLPVIEAHVDYKRPARYDDELTITGWLEYASGVKMKVCCEVSRDGELLASGYTIHACVSTKTQRPLRVPQHLADFAARSAPRPEA
ncbi:MAG: acyl-CoA thioesterase [Kiritimatiellia bacterium]|jgi:acyl-CoA thioester hydrolase